jgi:hypothetical protein
MFSDNSRWRPDVQQAEALQQLLRADTSFLAFEALNGHLVRMLSDRRLLGQLVTTPGAATGPTERRRAIERGGLAVLLESGRSVAWDRDRAIRDGLVDHYEELARATTSIRVCDFYAWLLSAHYQAPTFRPFWSVAERNRALDEMSTWLTKQAGVHERPRRPERTTVF